MTREYKTPEKQRTAVNARNAERKNRDACAVCGEPADGKYMCKKHRADKAVYTRKRRAARRAAGLCPDCPASHANPTVPGKARCRLHLDACTEVARRYHEVSAAAGRCRTCVNPKIPGRTLCESCAVKASNNQKAYYAARTSARKAAGLCPRCPNSDVKPVVKGMSLCQTHLDKQKEVDARHRAKKNQKT